MYIGTGNGESKHFGSSGPGQEVERLKGRFTPGDTYEINYLKMLAENGEVPWRILGDSGIAFMTEDSELLEVTGASENIGFSDGDDDRSTTEQIRIIFTAT